MGNTVETVPEAALEVLPQESRQFKGLIELSERIEAVVAAQNKIRTAILKAALPGDFIKFGDKIELGGPGSDRIGALIGMNVTSIRDEKISWEDKNGAAYTWIYTGDVSAGGRMIEKVEGRASSRDMFFGYQNGAWKELADVKESDIRTAARRSLYKEGVKLLVGLRALPADDAFLTSIGLDPKKVKSVNFASNSVTGDAKEITSLIKHIGQRKTKNDKTVYVIEFASGEKGDTFSKTLAELASKHWKAGQTVKAKLKPTQYGHNLESLEAVAADTPAEPKEAADAQE